MKTVFVPRETADNETRTALIPQDVSILTRTGFEISVESGTGVKSGYLDADYAKAGAKSFPPPKPLPRLPPPTSFCACKNRKTPKVSNPARST